MADELWIVELKQWAWRAQMDKYGSVAVEPEQLLKLIEMATDAPPADALDQCQSREKSLKEEIDDLEDEARDLRYENEYLGQRVEELETEVERLGDEAERNLRA